MHLLLAQKGTIQEGNEALDLGQDPADIVFLSAADTEISAVASARRLLGGEKFSLRVANIMHLTHPMSVDLYAQKVVSGSKLVVIRPLGGESYFSYLLEKFAGVARQHDCRLVVVPGDNKPEPGLARFCTENAHDCELLWHYLLEGGPDNVANFLRYCLFLLGRNEKPSAAIPLLQAGIWSPEHGMCSLAKIKESWKIDRPVVGICFYRALLQAGNVEVLRSLVDSLIGRGLNPLPLFVTSLKDEVCTSIVREILSQVDTGLVINLTGFSQSSGAASRNPTVLETGGAMVLQAVLAMNREDQWRAASQGLNARDLAMNVALPELDGRVLSRAIGFKQAGEFDEDLQTSLIAHKAIDDRIGFVADLARSWLRIRGQAPGKRKIALVLANYPNKDGRLGNGVGLDTPQALVEVVKALNQQGYALDEVYQDSAALMACIRRKPTNAGYQDREHGACLLLNNYNAFFKTLPVQLQNQVEDRWGKPNNDPMFDKQIQGFALPLQVNGNIVIGVQPARGYNIDPKSSYHSPDLVPPHNYLAFYGWLRTEFDVDAYIHMGKHGNLEWLPGKALALSEHCFPEAVMGPVPNLYPFIVNDPGEGTQAKRRTSAVIIDHLTPPLTRAESYGPLRDLEALVDEYYEASGNDPKRVRMLGRAILDKTRDLNLDKDAGFTSDDGELAQLEKLDAYLCELKEMQIRNGLHIFGRSPGNDLRHDLAMALVRVPRGEGDGRNQSLVRAIAHDLDLKFDPLDCEMSSPWEGPRPAVLEDTTSDHWRSVGDTVERIELYGVQLIQAGRVTGLNMPQTAEVLAYVNDVVLPHIDACGDQEMKGLLTGLEGRFVEPGPSGAPSRGRNDVLPTGRNFYSIDSRAVPTQTAWALGRKSAELLITRYRQDHGEWPISMGLSVWGTSNMRTGGDDIAQALALIGVKPVWDLASRRMTGYEIITLAELGRPRVDVTLRISGFFRDAFPAQIELFDKAIRAVGALEEQDHDNPIAMAMREAATTMINHGEETSLAMRKAGYRVFGSKPGAYGAGLQALIDEKGWSEREDLAESYLQWGGYAYGEMEEGDGARDEFSQRLKGLGAIIHNQDNREHDLLDSDDYYQFEGGMSAAVESLSGERASIYHNDHSRPERPVVRTLDEEIGRVVRARAANPKWIKGVMRHGYKGAFEMAATLDYLFAFAATTGSVRNHHFDLLYEAYLGKVEVREFIAENNPDALKEMAERFLEAIDRQLWIPRSNSAKGDLEIMAGFLSGRSQNQQI